MKRGGVQKTKHLAYVISWLPDGYIRNFKMLVFGPSGLWTMSPLRCAAKFDPFLSLDCAPALHPDAIQGKEGIKFCHLATLCHMCMVSPLEARAALPRRRPQLCRPLAGGAQGTGRREILQLQVQCDSLLRSTGLRTF